MIYIPKPKEKSAIDGKGETKSLIAKLVRVCHLFVRMRDTPYGCRGVNSWGFCISCKKIIVFDGSDINASHFIPGDKRHWGTKFHEKNIHASCVPCNAWMEGNRVPYLKALIKLYGAGIENELNLINALNPKKPDAFWLREKIKYYQEKIKELSP